MYSNGYSYWQYPLRNKKNNSVVGDKGQSKITDAHSKQKIDSEEEKVHTRVMSKKIVSADR